MLICNTGTGIRSIIRSGSRALRTFTTRVIRLTESLQQYLSFMMKDIGLPKGIAYACLAETIVLALEGRFENFTLGRNIEWEKSA